jgi:hypothetical protein
MLRSAIVTLSLVLVSCSQSTSTGSSSRETRELEEKPNLDYASLDGLGQKSEYIAGVDYDVELKTNSGIVVCRGNVVMFIKSSFSLEFPDSKINCASASIDITKILSGLGVHNPDAREDFKAEENGDTLVVLDPDNGNGVIVNDANSTRDVDSFDLRLNKDPFESSAGLALGAGAISLDSFSSDGMVLYASDLFGTSFNPPRPLLLGPVIIDPIKYQGYETAIPGTATKGGTVASGTHKVTVLETGGSYVNDLGNVSFENIIHWRIEHEGFKQLSVIDTFLPKKIEVKTNINPVMIPEIKITIPTDNLLMMDLGGLEALVGGLVGDVHFSLTVNNYKFKE